jgi:small-conductance mechanosensitive channel/CRP-like cAMP-binding protein
MRWTALGSRWLLGLASIEAPSRGVWTFGLTALAAWLLLALVIERARRGQLRVPALLLLAWALSTLVWNTRAFSVPLRDVCEVISHVTVALAATRIGWLLIVGRLLKDGSRIGLSKIARDLLHSALMIFVAVSAARAAGADARSLATTGGLVTAALTFSLQQTLGDLVAGLLLSARAPFEVGDWIAYDGERQHVGRVIEISWRDTKLITSDEIEVVVPNSTLSRASILNFSQPSPTSRRQVSFEVGYEHPPELVRATILRALVDPIEGALRTPAADVLVAEYAASAVRYAVRYFIDDFARRDLIDSEVRTRLWYALRRAGVDFQYSHLDVRLLETRSARPESSAERRARALSRVDFLRRTDPEDLAALASATQIRLFHSGEVVVREGDTTTALYIVASGECVVRTEAGRELARVREGDFFGEMALLTGEPRSATVAASSECMLYEVPADAFHSVIARYPEKLEQISSVVSERQAEIGRSPGTDVTVEAKARQRETLLSRMRRFFGDRPSVT